MLKIYSITQNQFQQHETEKTAILE